MATFLLHQEAFNFSLLQSMLQPCTHPRFPSASIKLLKRSCIPRFLHPKQIESTTAKCNYSFSGNNEIEVVAAFTYYVRQGSPSSHCPGFFVFLLLICSFFSLVAAGRPSKGCKAQIEVINCSKTMMPAFIPSRPGRFIELQSLGFCSLFCHGHIGLPLA